MEVDGDEAKDDGCWAEHGMGVAWISSVQTCALGTARFLAGHLTAVEASHVVISA